MTAPVDLHELAGDVPRATASAAERLQAHNAVTIRARSMTELLLVLYGVGRQLAEVDRAYAVTIEPHGERPIATIEMEVPW